MAKCEDAVRRDPGFVMAHALKGLFLVLSTGAGPAHPEVLKCRRRCQKLVEKGASVGVSPRARAREPSITP